MLDVLTRSLLLSAIVGCAHASGSSAPLAPASEPVASEPAPPDAPAAAAEPAPETVDPAEPSPQPERPSLPSRHLERAVEVANAALVRAYEISKRRREFVGPPAAPQVEAGQARVRGDAQHGWEVQFRRMATAGYEYDVVVKVRPSGQATAKKGTYALYSPD